MSFRKYASNKAKITVHAYDSAVFNVYFHLAIGVFLTIISHIPVVMGCFGPLNLEDPPTRGPTKLIRLCVIIIWQKIIFTGSYVGILHHQVWCPICFSARAN